jgi:hypothetical protein
MNTNETKNDTTKSPETQAPESGMEGLFGAALALGALWLGGKVIKAGLERVQDGSAGDGGGLPAEFSQNRSRASTEIPGQSEASRIAALQREMQRREQGKQLGNMMITHMQNMNRIRRNW